MARSKKGDNSKSKSKKGTKQSLEFLAKSTLPTATVATPSASPVTTLTLGKKGTRLGTTAQPELNDGTDSSLPDYEQERGRLYATDPGPSKRDPVYAQVLKKKKVPADFSDDDDRVPTSSALRRFSSDDIKDTLFQRGGQRGSRRSRRSNSSLEHVQASGMTHSLPSTNGRKASPSPSRSARGVQPSPRLMKLAQENAELKQLSQYLQQQLVASLHEQDKLVDTLKATDGDDDDTLSQLHDAHNETRHRQQELVQSLEKRAEVLELEKKELEEENNQLQHEVFSLRKMASFKTDLSVDESSQTTVLKRELQNYKEEASTLRSAIQRLNSELSRYQTRFRPLRPNELDDIAGLPLKGPRPSWLVDTKYLAPLFLAYDDVLVEKTAALQQSQEDLAIIKQSIDEVLRENQRLHLRLEQADVTGPVGMTEWRQLQEQCRLVLEENQLLMEQLDLQQQKASDMHRAHVEEVTRLSKQVVQLQTDKSKVESQMHSLSTRIGQQSTTSVHYDRLEEHVVTITELKKNLQNERQKHAGEYENLLTKVKEISAERKSLEVQLESLRTENKKMEGEIKALHRAQRKSHRVTLLLKQALEEAQIKEKMSEKYLKSVVQAAEETQRDKEYLEKSAKDREQEKKEAVKKLQQGAISQSKMEDKLKVHKEKVDKKLELAIQKLRDQENDFNTQRQEYLRQLEHLRNLLREKDDLLTCLTGDYRKTENDLETLWQVASHDNRRMKESVSESIRKMRQHESFRELNFDIPVASKYIEKLPLVTSDEETRENANDNNQQL